MGYFKSILLALTLLWSSTAAAVVVCSNISVAMLQSASSSEFHNFNEVGLTGSTVFIYVPPANCTDSAGDPLSSVIYMVLDDMEQADALKQAWSSVLLSAQLSNKQLNVTANNLGENSKGYQVIEPVYLRVAQ